jgi:hypothetical protein
MSLTCLNGNVPKQELDLLQFAAGRMTKAYDTDGASKRRQRVTVLHIHPIKSARDAVKAAIAR